MANGIFGHKAVILSRVSTQGQVLQEGFSPQQNDLMIWANQMGYTEFHSIDTAESGFLELESRDGWNNIFAFLEKNPDYRTIIVTEINRLARNESVLMFVKDYLYKHKIQLLVKDLNFCLLNPDGEKSLGADLMFNIYTSMAHFEMSTKNERKIRALKEYRKKGYSIGGAELFGYTRQIGGELGTKKNYRINEEEAKEIQTIYKWYANGIDGDMRVPSIYRITMECIARGMSKYLHSERNVKKCLREAAYTGFKTTKNKKKNKEYWNYNKKDAPKYIDAEQYECTYPQIISQALFEQVQELLKKRSPHNIEDVGEYVDKSRKHTTILSKRIVCPCCGKYLVGEYRKSEGYFKHTYRCSSSRGVVNLCKFKTSLSMVMMDSAIWSYIQLYTKAIISFKMDALNNSNITEQEQSILRLEENLKQFEVRYETEDNIYRGNIRRAYDDEAQKRALEKYEEQIAKIDKDREDCLREINSRRRRLEEIKKQTRELQNANTINLESIKNNKEEMYRYVHILIDKVLPLYFDNKYVILQVISFPIATSLNYLEGNDIYEDSTGDMRKEYLVINKRNTNSIKLVSVLDAWGWDDVQKTFITDKQFTIPIHEIAETDWTNRDSVGQIIDKYQIEYMGVKVLDYDKLSFYEMDI